MRRIGALEAQGLRVQQYRAAAAGEPKQPPADGDQRHSGDAELPLVEPAKMPTAFRTESERPFIAANSPPMPPTTLVASRMVRSRPVLSLSIARGWTVSPIKSYHAPNGGATRI
jgi:hypothetical protein